jgi:hypothetical protein
MLEKFNMDKAYPCNTPMVVRSLDRMRMKRFWDLKFLI